MSVGRFQVMATLQAARAHALGLPDETAFSFGLNRAIMFKVFKTGGGHGGGKRPAGAQVVFNGEGRTEQRPILPFEGLLAEDMKDDRNTHITQDGQLLFEFAGDVQTVYRFNASIKSRFGSSWSKAWEQAIKYVAGFDKSVLMSGTDFYKRVYHPMRDSFVEQWGNPAPAMEAQVSAPPKRPDRSVPPSQRKMFSWQ